MPSKLHLSHFRVCPFLFVLPIGGVCFVPSAQGPSVKQPIAAFHLKRAQIQRKSTVHTPYICDDVAKLRLFASSDPINDSTSTINDKEQPTFSKRIVDSLDLSLLIEGVARHTSTRRGRDALLSFAGMGSGDFVGGGGSRADVGSPRHRQLKRYDRFDGFSSLGIPEHVPAVDVASEHQQIAQIARSAVEAREEYELVREAMFVLRSDLKTKMAPPFSNRVEESRNHEGGNTKIEQFEEKTSILPPIYGVSASPWDLSEVSSDDDEWLDGALSGYASTLDLESILQAEQVVKKMLETRSWADLPTVKEQVPGLSQIGHEIDHTILEELYSDLMGAVEIVRTRTLDGRKSFAFRLCGDKYQDIGDLRRKELDLIADIKCSLQGFAAPSERDGRFVVSAPPDAASSMGIVRGFSKEGEVCYVEPKSVMQRGDALSKIREDIANVENEIKRHLIISIIRASPYVALGLDLISRLDVIFAKAAFGCVSGGIIPTVGSGGQIQVKDFVQPVLALQKMGNGGKGYSRMIGVDDVVPIDLNVPGNEGARALIISGPNGGGKTLALRSFGLAAIMCKLGIPIPIDRAQARQNNKSPRVDFFHEIFVEVGDQQSIMQGQSTLMARLNACSEVIQKVSRCQALDKSTEGSSECGGVHVLVLMDEMGGGTDPEAGSAIAQSVLEKLLEYAGSQIVATTHSPQLKLLAIDEAGFDCASVLLEGSEDSLQSFKRPTFRLAYGIVGDSYALGAASRCTPGLPDDVLTRAADLMAGAEQGKGSVLRSITRAIEQEKETALKESMEAKRYREDMKKCRDALISLAIAHEQNLSRLESRLDAVYRELKEDKSNGILDIAGDTLAELQLVKKRVKSQAESLAERGLKMVPFSYDLKEGETVIIIAEGEWEGQTGTVVTSNRSDSENSACAKGQSPRDSVFVMPNANWGMAGADLVFDSESGNKQDVLVLKRSEIAVWDYPSQMDWENNIEQIPAARSVSDSRRKLFNTLSTLKSADDKKLVETTSAPEPRTFTSARARKAAAAVSKKEKKSRKKGKKKRK